MGMEIQVYSVRTVSCDYQVIVDLGHVTFGSVSDWSEEQERILEEAMQLLATNNAMETEDDDEGKPLQLIDNET